VSALPSPSHYDALQLPPDASTAQVRAAWRRLAAQHHPDRGGLDAAAMARLNQAYEVLSDPHRRASYDALQWPRQPRRLRTLREAAIRGRRLRVLLLVLLPLAMGAGWALVRGAPSAAAPPAEPPLHLVPSLQLDTAPLARRAASAPR